MAMRAVSSILLPLDGSPEAAKGIGCALWLAQALGATLHVLHAASQPVGADEALARLRMPDRQPQVVLHQLREGAQAAVLHAIALHAVDLVVMSAGGASASAGRKPPLSLGSVARAVLERSPVPVLLLPLRYREALPWTSILAAASGEMAADEALAAALELAFMLHVGVTILHAENGLGAARRKPLCAYADAPYHEYRNRFQGMIERVAAGCTPDAHRCIEQAMLRRGDATEVLLEQLARRSGSILAVGWHGALDAGRALVLKRLLERAECALLVVRGSERSRARLKVGQEFDDATS
jgi:nucleotide-binding universal stress UspA family protein